VEARVKPSLIDRVQRILGWLSPSAQAEALLGDLLEESRLRLQTGSPASVARWYWMQLASSIPVLLWASLRSGRSFITIAVAVAGYFVAAAVQLVLRAALSSMTTSAFARTAIVLLSGIAATAAAGFVAALIRRGAAPVLAVLVLVATSIMLAANPDTVPLWYKSSFLVLGSLAPIAGAALSGRWRKA